MKKLIVLWITALLVFGLAVTAFGAGDAGGTNSYVTCEMQIMALSRDDPDNQTLMTTGYFEDYSAQNLQATFYGEELMNANQFNFSNETGYRFNLTVHRLHESCWDLELAALANTTFSDNIPGVYSSSGAQGPLPGFGNTNYPAYVSGVYSSELSGGELNLKRPTTDWLTLLAGYRMLTLNETLTINHDVMASTINHARYTLNTQNNLSGFQIGADLHGGPWQRFSIDCLLKAGWLRDEAKSNVLFTQQVGTTKLQWRAADHDGAAIKEAALAGRFQITKKSSLGLGYQWLALDGVALAPDQAPITYIDSDNIVDTDGDVMYRGAFLGFEYRF